MLGILHVVAIAVAGIFALLALATLFAIADGTSDTAFLMILVAALGAFASFLVLAAIAGFPRRLGRAPGYLALVAVWTLTPLAAAAAFAALTDMPLVDAWFEAVSALTTSGTSLLSRQTTPLAIIFWRASLEWYGGFLTLLSIIHVLAPAGFGGLPAGDRRLQTGQPTDMTVSLEVFRDVLGQYVLMTAAIAIGLMVAGVEPTIAGMLGMVAIATGGFLPFDGALEDHAGPIAQLVLALGLGLGTVSVFWRNIIIRAPRRFFTDNPETAIVCLVIFVLSVIYAARLAAVSGGSLPPGSIGPAVAESILTATSLVATSGWETRPGLIALLPDIAVLMVVLVGAGIYSTTGGIKIYRVGAMAAHALRDLGMIIYPTSVKSVRFGRFSVNEESMRAIWAYFVLTLAVISFSTIGFSLTATGFDAAASLAIAFFANAGPIYEAFIPPNFVTEPANDVWPALAALPPAAKIIAIVTMTLGRLEVLVLFAVLNVRYWLNR